MSASAQPAAFAEAHAAAGVFLLDEQGQPLSIDTSGAVIPDLLPPGQEWVNGQVYMRDTKGRLTPIEAVRTTDRLQDEVVRKIVGYAEPLSAEIGRFREHTFDDVDDFVSLLAQEYGAKRGGAKGNTTLISFDGLMKVQVAVSDLISFGPELKAAKELVDDCLREWAAQANANLRTIVERAFATDKEGNISPSDLFSLLRSDFPDERWKRAMDAIRDSIRVIGTKRYIRIYKRPAPDAEWSQTSLDAASAKAVAA